MELSEILAGRAGLAGVQWALTGQPARAALRGLLNSLLSGAELGPCRLRRAKYKLDRYLTAYYDVTLHSRDGHHPGDGGNGSPVPSTTLVRPIALTWALPKETGAPGLPSDPASVQGEAFSRGLLRPFQQLSAETPEWGLRLQISPLDVQFPQLVRLSDPRYVQEMLAVGLEAGSRGPALPAQYSITTIRYRPGQRHVLRYDAHPEPEAPGGKTFFAKIYNKPAKGARAFETAIQISNWLDAHSVGMQGARPLAWLAEDGVILYPRVAGIPLSRLLKGTGRRTGRHLRLAGSALRALHALPVSLMAGLEHKTLANEIQTVKHASDHLRALYPQARAKIIELIERTEALHARLPQEPETFTHSDLKADHMLVSSTGLTLIDFDTCALADPAFDIGKFLADLDWWHAQYSKPDATEAQEQFIAGYIQGAPGAPDIPPARLKRARLYEALILLRITVRRVPLFSRDWAEMTLRLVQQAEGILNSLLQ
jgi:thiamine kinase-like enzyme